MTAPDLERSSGVLLHVTSLPGAYGIGDLGPAAHVWIDWLARSGTTYWQMLPLGPTGFGDSPYSSFSSHAGNVDLISPEALVNDGFLTDVPTPVGEEDRVDYAAVRVAKREMLEEAFSALSAPRREEFRAFQTSERAWLGPFALYMALKEAHNGEPWTSWPESLRVRDAGALDEAAARHSKEMDFHAFGQFVFHLQLEALRAHARSSDVEIVGDVPFYVASDSVDVWLHPELFTLGHSGEPSHVAGVPPDMFSEEGQRWGNPLYQWGMHAADGYAWWADRLRAFLRHADVLRIDHFTGFATYWEIEASEPTAVEGRWRKGPGARLFRAIEQELGVIPIIVEDLGPAGQIVEDLRLELGYPGMMLMQELFTHDGPYPPIGEDRVAYTGTHDNDTALGRYESETEPYRRRALQYTGVDEEGYAWGLVEAAWSSPAVVSVAPMQDLLGLGSEARMNLPSTTSGNWQWRMPPGSATSELSHDLAELNVRTDRRA
jgi:4-alpha-glucanotransferase